MSSFHFYCSTACHHGLHDECRLSCKWCREPCCCPCHDAQGEAIEDELAIERDLHEGSGSSPPTT